MESLKFEEFLRSRGYKVTSQRIAVFNEILSTDGHFEIEEIYRRLKRKGEDVSRATVYRTVKLMLEGGFIKETATDEKHPHYERTSTGFHGHIVCRKCGKVIEFQVSEIEPLRKVELLQKELSERYGFQFLSCKFEIHGICEECRGKR